MRNVLPSFYAYTVKSSLERDNVHMVMYVLYITCIFNFADSCEADAFISYRTAAFRGQVHY